MRFQLFIMEAIRQNLGLDDASDESKDGIINKMSKSEAFERFLTWQGIIGYSSLITTAIEDIYSVELKGA